MSTWSDVTRPFWLSGLHEVTGYQAKGIGGWICDEEYQIYTPVTDTSFVLSFADKTPVLEAFASDINRIAAAAFETIYSVSKLAALPKSTAWLIIQTYYSGFFAAHALLRLFGASCAPLEREQIKSITTIATAYGNMASKPLSGGLYHLRCEMKAGQVLGDHLVGSPHESFWKVFYEWVIGLSTAVLTSPTGTVANRQTVSVKLSDLAANLCFASASRGRWLSTVRNAVNYAQKHSTWFPYTGQKTYYQYLFDKSAEWKSDPLSLELAAHEDKELRRFQVSCSFLIAALRESIAEMAVRCPERGQSFHTYGSLAFLNLANQSGSTARRSS